MAHRVHNFNAGPAALPLPALLRAQEELVDWSGTGMSVLEHSHRGKVYEAMHHDTLARVRKLAGLPESHEILLVQGGASMQFATVPMNFLRAGEVADYVVHGTWGEKAIAEAKLLGDARLAGKHETYGGCVPDDRLALTPGAAYVHYTTTETSHGAQYHHIPDVKGAPLVADMSSDIFSRPFDFAKHALVYGGAQKNLGPSGLVVIFVEKSFLAKARADIPTIFRFQTHQKNDSLYNTIPTFAVYLLRNVCLWLEERGGLAAMGAENDRKQRMLYDALDGANGYYDLPVEKGARSWMNVVFRLPSPEAEAKFLAEAERREMVGLKGHRSVGGIRASIYNAAAGCPRTPSAAGA